ncbi:hypothetical protein KQI36_04345 [Clostridium senegalense]|uniref:hypothetical protein n=1 Tax=Clostridium senegalense TaxID=1465809 RepID=UPI001C11D1F0|nr:hypothetical protein [Clostridium senegalense]MBU5225894.1 hypothetical protein [Clostridium senegalense]
MKKIILSLIMATTMTLGATGMVFAGTSNNVETKSQNMQSEVKSEIAPVKISDGTETPAVEENTNDQCYYGGDKENCPQNRENCEQNKENCKQNRGCCNGNGPKIRNGNGNVEQGV